MADNAASLRTYSAQVRNNKCLIIFMHSPDDSFKSLQHHPESFSLRLHVDLLHYHP